MPISGLVLTLTEDPVRREFALAALEDRESLHVGDLFEHRLPIVVDAPDSEANRETWHWLHTVPGIVFVDLVCADCSADHTAEEPVAEDRE